MTSEDERRRRYKAAKERRRRRWQEREARQVPIEVAIYGVGSTVASLSFFGWWIVTPHDLFPSIGLTCSLIVFCAANYVTDQFEGPVQ